MTMCFKVFMLALIWTFAPGCSSTRDNAESSTKSPTGNKAPDKEVVCFVYHRFGDQRYPSTNVSLADFEAHLNYLKANDFQVLPFTKALDYLHSASEKQKTAVITIDDGYKSFYENGLPLLEKYGFPATLFINTKTVGGGDYMDWDAIKEASNRGIEIGNHTHSHQYFLNLAEEERYQIFEEELRVTQKLIKENLGKEPTTFAYPYGEFDAEMKKIVKKLGFKGAAAQNSGVIHSQSDLLQCPRFPMSEYYAAPEKFASKAQMHSLKVTGQRTGSSLLPPGETKPQLALEFAAENLQLDQLQCFIQGGDCKKELVTNDGQVTLTLTAQTDISSRRRTLYTVTVPDKNGQWYWYSHLWINPEVE